MTSTAQLDYEEYPQYCYELSPTITRWCPLRARDIVKLRWHPGFEGQDDTFFHLNHPIRWVRIMGVVVAIDSYSGRWVYTVDDSTGVCMECHTMGTTTKAAKNNASAGAKTQNSDAAAGQADYGQSKVYDISAPASPYPDIDVGMVVDIKGNLTLYRNNKQIKIKEMERVRSTDKEVRFWNKIEVFDKTVLSQPWVVDRAVLRKLEKEMREDQDSKERERRRREREKKKQQRKAQQKEMHDARDQEPSKYRPRAEYGGSGSGSGRSGSSGSGLKRPYRPSKLSSVTAAEEEHYDALGL